MDQTMRHEIIELRHTLHRHPQTAGHEAPVCQLLMDFLRPRTGLVLHDRGDWFYAVKPGRRPQTIALRADLDALAIPETIDLPYGSLTPGVSEKCGHDGHCAILAGAAWQLDQLEDIPTVVFLFQPAEETGHGARECRGLLNELGVSEIYGLHNLPGYPLGQVVYHRRESQPASEGIRLIFTGQASHASEPEQGRNPDEVLARLDLWLRQRRRLIPEDRLTLATVVHAALGSADFGISPGDGELDVTLRAIRDSDLRQLEQDLLAQAADLAQQYGLAFRWQKQDEFCAVVNDPRCLALMLEAAQRCGLPAREMEHYWRASEDFGYYTQVCPGAIVYLGAGEDHAALHTPQYDFDDRLIEPGVALFTALAQGRRRDTVADADAVQ
jgi:amidohydrolase